MLWGWLWLSVAVLVASSAIAMTAAHRRRILRTTHADPGRTASWLRSIRPEERVERLLARAGADCWEGQLCEELAAAPSASARLAAMNAALGEIAHELEATSRLPFVAVRMSAWAGLLLAILAYLQGAPSLTGWILVVGAAGAMVSWVMGRQARTQADARRRGLDELVHVLTGGRAAPPSLRQAVRRRRN